MKKLKIVIIISSIVFFLLYIAKNILLPYNLNKAKRDIEQKHIQIIDTVKPKNFQEKRTIAKLMGFDYQIVPNKFLFSLAKKGIKDYNEKMK